MVVPAIIPESLEHLRASLVALAPKTKTFQVDIVDGRFVPFLSWPYHEGDSIEDGAHIYEGYDIELDLMVQDPEETLQRWINTGIQRVVIHVESTNNLAECITIAKGRGALVGLSLLNDTDISVLDPHIESIDFVQCMGIKEIGMQGNSFDERVLDRVRALREAHSDLEISVDGSMNETTIARVKDAGATRFISGSAIYRAPDPITAYERLSALA